LVYIVGKAVCSAYIYVRFNLDMFEVSSDGKETGDEEDNDNL